MREPHMGGLEGLLRTGRGGGERLCGGGEKTKIARL